MRTRLIPGACTIAVLAATVLTSCGKAPVARGINDPYEAHNRAVHETNKYIDRTILKRLTAGGSGEPGPVLKTVGNFANNLATPGDILNDILQANVDDAAHNFTRFLINSTFGLAGIFDPATDMGLHARESDFGETLHVWGFSEGHFVELPLLGASTKRDAIGKAVDLVINPLQLVIPSPERYALPLFGAASRMSDRYRYGDLIDSTFHGSADSYGQLRLIYLENRRFKLGGGVERTEEANLCEDQYVFDPYDPYADIYQEESQSCAN